MKKTFRWLYGYVKPHKGAFSLNIVCLFMNSGIAIAQAFLIQRLVQESVDGIGPDSIYRSLALLSVLVVLGIGVSFLAAYSNAGYGNGAIQDLKDGLAAHVADMRVSELDESHSGDLASRINNDIGQIQGFVKNHVARIIFLPVMGISAAAYMISLNPLLFFACFLPTPIALFFSDKFRRRVNGLSVEIQEYLGKASGVLQDIIGGIPIVKAFQIERAVFDKCCRHLDFSLKKGYEADKYASISIMTFIIMYELPNILCLVLGGIFAYQSRIKLGEFVAFRQLIRYVVEPAMGFSYLLLSISTTHGAIERIREIFAKPLERTTGTAFPDSGMDEILGAENLMFSYGEGPRILDGFGFSIGRGGSFALVGASGSGKTTVLKLLNGFYEADEGRLSLYGRDYRDWSLSRLRENFAVVSQEVYLFPGSVGDNIAYGRPGSGEEEIIEASKAAGADGFIRALPEGYGTNVGERGSRLSGGQRQRISIARAILKNAPILLLDEPTSALDNESERLVQDALDAFMRDRTTIVVAHRMSTIMNAQRIFVMEGGRIVESGRHEELIAARGSYFALYEKQFAAGSGGGSEECSAGPEKRD